MSEEQKYLARRQHRSHAGSYLFCLLTAAVLMALFSRSSFLYPFNNWSDTNVYMTIGREMLRGAVPYRDLFDHKGLLWYLLYLAANLISTRTYLGLYLIEVFSFSIFLYYSWKLLRLFCPQYYALCCLPFLGCLIAVSDAFGMGGSAEEIHLSFAAVGLYYLVRFLRDADPKQMPYSVVFVNGLLAGCVLWIKYSLLGFWFAWMASVFFLLLGRREWKRSLASCGIFLLGMGAASVPCLAYLLATGTLADFWHVYVTVNLQYASVSGPYSLTQRLHTSLQYFTMMFGWNKILGTLTLVGLFLVTLLPVITRNMLRRLLLPLTFLFSVGAAYLGTVSHFYYFMTVAPFLSLAFLFAGVMLKPAVAAIFGAVQKSASRSGKTVSVRMVRCATGIACAGTLLLSCVYGRMRSPNTFFMNYTRDELTQYQVAAILAQQEQPTLMYYNNLIDIGILMAAPNARPWGKYYFMPNISYEAFPEIRDSQEAGLRERQADFVFTYQYGTESLRQNYHLVRYFPSSEKDRGDSYLLMQANPYDLYTGCKLEFQDDGTFSYTLGDVDWKDEGDENAYVLIGTLRRPVLAEQVTVIAPKDADPQAWLYVSADGENWLPAESRTEFDETSLHFTPTEIRYVKLIRARNLNSTGIWQARIYEPASAAQQAENRESAIRSITTGDFMALRTDRASSGTGDAVSHTWTESMADNMTSLQTITTSAHGIDTDSALSPLTDHDVTTGWDSGTHQTAGMWLETDLAAPYTIRRIRLKTFEDYTPCPEQMLLYCATESGTMEPVPFTRDGNCLTPDAPVTTERFRLVLQEDAAQSWRIDEMEIYAAP